MKMSNKKIQVLLAVAALCMTGCKGGDNKPAEAVQPVAQEETAPAAVTPGKFPEGTDRYLDMSDLEGKSPEELKIMRNEIFARHGLKFTTEAMKTYFAVQDWYTPQYNNVDSMLTDIEKANVAFIQSRESGGEDAVIAGAKAMRFSAGYVKLLRAAGEYGEFNDFNLPCSDCGVKSLSVKNVTFTGSATATAKVVLTVVHPEGNERKNATLKMIKSGDKWYIDDVDNARASYKDVIAHRGYMD